VLCDKFGIDVKEVIDAASTKPFGFIPFYPSAGAGGHCIPKDPRFLLESAKRFGIEFKTLKDSLSVNSFMPVYISNTIKETITKQGLSKEHTPLKYRRVSDLLVELENSGMLISRAYSRGRGGYGKEYKLKIDPSLVGPSVDKGFYDSLVRRKASVDITEKLQKLYKPSKFGGRFSSLLKDF